MKASRSAASTTAPHLIILSTSLVHAALFSRCCTMMRESWHSRQAVRIFPCTGPGGSSGDWDQSCSTLRRVNTAIVHTHCRAKKFWKLSRCDMDLHLINRVVEISAWIPVGGLRLSSALTVGGAGHQCVVPRLGCFPIVIPQPPCVMSLLFA